MSCHRHPERRAAIWRRGVESPSLWTPLCEECRAELPPLPYHQRSDAAYGTGLGRTAHAEAQEAKRFQDEYERGKQRYEIIRGGKPV